MKNSNIQCFQEQGFFLLVNFPGEACQISERCLPIMPYLSDTAKWAVQGN